MAPLSGRVLRRLGDLVREAVNPRFDQLEDRLRRLDDKLDVINHLVATIDSKVQDNRQQILGARHEAHMLMVTDIDAANEATALLGRSLADQRDMVEERLDRVEAQLAEVTTRLVALAERDQPIG